MNNAAIFHGSSETPNSYWYPSIKSYLEKNGFRVWVPQLPEPKRGTPELSLQLPLVLKHRYDKDTVLIGHSAGCPLIVSILEHIDVKIAKAILVAGYIRPLQGLPQSKGILQKKYDWKKIHSHAREFIFINSDNDPWKCNDKEGNFLFDKLGGMLIIRRGEGHMGSTKFHQPYPRFALLENLL